MITEPPVADEYGIPPAGFRLPPDTHLQGVLLQVSDLERSLSFYRDLLGLLLLSEGDGGARLGVPGSPHALVELIERRGARRHAAERLGLYHFAILLPERAALGRFLAFAVERGLRPGAADHTVSEALYIDDPDGLGIEVYVDRPRSRWRHRSRELVIGTAPLAVSSLLREDGAEWRGIPAGTTLGHVHLRVADLDEARGFYHEGLGLDLVSWSYPGALFLSAGGYHHHLGLNTWAGAGARPAEEDEPRLLEWSLCVPGGDALERAVQSLRAAGASPEREHRGWRLEDPWGTPLRLRSS